MMLEKLVNAVRGSASALLGSKQVDLRSNEDLTSSINDVSESTPLASWHKTFVDKPVIEGGIRVIFPEDDGFEDFGEQRTNREEIRRKLAMGTDESDMFGGDKFSRKPSLQARLQSGMNLQICFMNETASDPDAAVSTEGQGTEDNKEQDDKTTSEPTRADDEGWIPVKPRLSPPPETTTNGKEEDEDFVARQARLQQEARMALAQAQQMAHMQMEVERMGKKKSPTEETATTKMVGIPFPDGRRRLTRQILSDKNIAQLQVIVNDLHSRIETLNEDLVRYLLERDDLHMEQDSMLVDIEDLTRYLGAKHQSQPIETPKSVRESRNSDPETRTDYSSSQRLHRETKHTRSK